MSQTNLLEDVLKAVRAAQGIIEPCTHDKIKVTGNDEYTFAECVNPDCDWFEEL